MNENFEDQKKDIKPERPEVSSNRGSRRTKGGGLLLSSTLTIINLIGLVVLFLWFFNTSGNQQMAGQNFIERISGLEDSFNQQTDVIEDLNQNLDSELRFVCIPFKDTVELYPCLTINDFKNFLVHLYFVNPL